MVIVTKISVSLGLCEKSELDELTELLRSVGLPTECPYSADELASIATADKKRLGEYISFIIPQKIGDSRPMKVSVSELADFIAKGL